VTYKHWDLKNPFAKIEPPLHKAKESAVRICLRLAAFLPSPRNR
jgi:hypothetical protein